MPADLTAGGRRCAGRFPGESLTAVGAAALLCCLGWGAAASGEIVLFDAAAGTLPASQGWPFFADPTGSHSVTQSLTAQAVVLDTQQPLSDRAGYFSRDPVWGIFAHPLMPVTDRSSGYAIRFGLRVDAEAHVEGTAGDDNGDGLADRAGFSLITISQDLRGIEMGFWEDRIWVQNDDAAGPAALFTQAESVAFDTVAMARNYELRVRGDRYQLLLEGGIAPLLEGELRDYRGFSGNLDPYEIPSFLFLGDNSTRGEARVEIARIAVAEHPALCHDVDTLVSRIADGSHDPLFDLTGDGLVDGADLTRWLADAGSRFLGPGRSYLPGDANLDGVVDISDFNLWNGHKFTRTAAWCQGDFNADGFSDTSDFNLWNGFKFTSSAAVSVAEPSGGAAAIFAAGLMGWLGRLRRFVTVHGSRSGSCFGCAALVSSRSAKPINVPAPLICPGARADRRQPAAGRLSMR